MLAALCKTKLNRSEIHGPLGTRAYNKPFFCVITSLSLRNLKRYFLIFSDGGEDPYFPKVVKGEAL